MSEVDVVTADGNAARRLDELEQPFDKLPGMAFNRLIREIGDCYDSGRVVLHLEMCQSRAGAWEIELIDRDQGRRIQHQYDDEAAAREAVEIAYAFGRRGGRWRIQRSSDYQPAGAASPLGWDPPTPRSGASANTESSPPM